MTSPHRTSAFVGGVYMVAMRGADKLLGLASTLILARLLTPSDFGLVAMAMIAVGLIDILLDLGVGAALIQNNKADRHDFDTAWTLRLGQATVAGAIVAAASPLIAGYYGDDRVTAIMQVIAVTVFVGGLENIGTVRFQKDMEFGREFRFFVAKRVIGTVATIAIALTLRSYWALVIGSLVSRVVGVLLSYLMHPYRPRLSLARTRQIWSFSQWNIVSSIGNYLTMRTDQFVIGRRQDASVLGAYSVGGEIAAMPSTELIAPLARVMFPAFARVADQPPELLRIVLLALSTQALIGIPAGVGVALVAGEAVPLLLGDQWFPAVPFVQVLGLAGVVAAMMSSSRYLLLALGRIRTLALYNLAMFSLLALIIVVVLPSLQALGIAIVRLCVLLVGLVALQVSAARVLRGFGFKSILSNVWRPCLAAIFMAGSVMWLGRFMATQNIWLLFVAKVAMGVGTYALVVFLLWRLVGCPKGGETYLLEKLMRGRGTVASNG